MIKRSKGKFDSFLRCSVALENFDQMGNGQVGVAIANRDFVQILHLP